MLRPSGILWVFLVLAVARCAVLGSPDVLTVTQGLTVSASNPFAVFDKAHWCYDTNKDILRLYKPLTTVADCKFQSKLLEQYAASGLCGLFYNANYSVQGTRCRNSVTCISDQCIACVIRLCGSLCPRPPMPSFDPSTGCSDQPWGPTSSA